MYAVIPVTIVFIKLQYTGKSTLLQMWGHFILSYRNIQMKSARQVAISNARSNYTLGKAQQDMLDAGVMQPSETEEYYYDKESDTATWEGKINGTLYKAEFPGKSGNGNIVTGE